MAAMAAAGVGAVLTCRLGGSAFESGTTPARNAGGAVALAGLRPLALRRKAVESRRVLGSVRRRERRNQGVCAQLDRGSGGSDTKEKKKFITKEEEPAQYWQAADEKEGKNPMASPLPYIVILSVLSPFLILAVAFANNWIKIPVR